MKSRKKIEIIILSILICSFFVTIAFFALKGREIENNTSSNIQTNKADLQDRVDRNSNVDMPTPSELLELINNERTSQNAPVLILDNKLNQSAKTKADDMANNNYFAHANPVDGKRGVTYITEYAPNQCSYIGENLATFSIDRTGGIIYPSDIANTSFEGWKDSKSHYDAMIDPKNKVTGFGSAKIIKGDIIQFYVVEHFCQPF